MKILHLESNKIYIQVSEFKNVTRDWNNDNDIYTIYGAYFNFNNENWNEFISRDEVFSDSYKILE